MPIIDRALRIGEGKKFKQFERNVARVNDYEPELELESDDELRDYARFAPPPWVRSAPDLQTDGVFDPAKYQRLLASSQAAQASIIGAQPLTA